MRLIEKRILVDLESLRKLLLKYGEPDLAAFVEELVFLEDTDREEFMLRLAYSASLWGGSGSVIDLELEPLMGQSFEEFEADAAKLADIPISLGDSLTQLGMGDSSGAHRAKMLLDALPLRKIGRRLRWKSDSNEPVEGSVDMAKFVKVLEDLQEVWARHGYADRAAYVGSLIDQAVSAEEAESSRKPQQDFSEDPFISALLADKVALSMMFDYLTEELTKRGISAAEAKRIMTPFADLLQ